METNAPPINDIVAYLDTYDSSKLEELKVRFPDFQKFLVPGKILNKRNDEVSEEEVKFRLVSSQEFLTIAKAESISKGDILTNKLSRLSNIQLTSQIISLISGATIISVLKVDFKQFEFIKYIPPILVLLTSALTLYFKNKSEAKIGGNENLFTLHSKLVIAEEDAKFLLKEIETCLKFFKMKQAESTIEDANSLARKLDLLNKIKF